MLLLVVPKGTTKFLERLPPNINRRIIEKLERSQENPFFFFERLEGKPQYKLRIGDYRVIAELNQEQKIILVALIGHRKNIYQK
ncbi:type II toxin-antitoxin system RelE/ParE family toxin [Candidatus Woesearchaeota archaeon]|nr:type II toxin-antitoxin system RelE/ParE family toxin [Candidatus Woesearchaeota archaeon]